MWASFFPHCFVKAILKAPSQNTSGSMECSLKMAHSDNQNRKCTNWGGSLTASQVPRDVVAFGDNFLQERQAHYEGLYWTRGSRETGGTKEFWWTSLSSHPSLKDQKKAWYVIYCLIYYIYLDIFVCTYMCACTYIYKHCQAFCSHHKWGIVSPTYNVNLKQEEPQ